MRNNSLIKILKFMKKAIIPYIIAVFALAILSLSLQLSLAIMFKQMFEAIANNNYDSMFFYVKKYSIYILAIFLIYPLFSYIVEAAKYITTSNIKKALFNKLEKLKMEYYVNNHSGELISVMTNDVNEVEKAYSSLFTRFVTNIIMGVGTTVAAFFIEWRLALVAIFSGLISLFVNLYYAKKLRNASSEIQEKLAKVNENLTNILDGIHVIKNFNIFNIIFNKYKDENNKVYETSSKRVKYEAIIDTINTLVGIISFIGITSLGAYLTIKGEITIGVIIAVIQLQNGLTMFLTSIGSFISGLQSSFAASDRIFALLDESDEPNKLDNVTILNDSNAILEFINVSFNYDNESIINNLSFSLPKGKSYALVGPSGSGKSTIFKLLLNFYEANEGKINYKIGYNNIKNIREMIAYVPQNAYLFSGTIAENILYGNTNKTLEDVKEAARRAKCDNFINELEHGYDTYVGERGANLSGGQRQRIAIARAILKDAPILLLDEATSALDAESEKLVQESLDKLMKDKTTLVIAHRLSTIKNVDMIMVLNEGKVVEQGNHEELLKNNNGIYYRLYNNQYSKV